MVVWHVEDGICSLATHPPMRLFEYTGWQLDKFGWFEKAMVIVVMIGLEGIISVLEAMKRFIA